MVFVQLEPMASHTALVEADLLVWARDSVNLSVEAAAKKIDIAPAKLAAWESGEASPTIAQLRTVAQVYKRPLAIFFLSKPPKDFDAIRDFRGFGVDAPMTPELSYEIRRAHEKREVALELAATLDEKPTRFRARADMSDDPTEVGRRLRKLLGIELATQFSWKGEYDALNAWKAAIEATGALVFEMRAVDVSEARGFSVANEVYPIIVLNGSDSPLGRVFTLGHELAHLLTRNSGVCEYVDHASPVETFCNRVSAELLMPSQDVLRERIVKNRDESALGKVQALAARFRVSREAMAIRLGDLEVISKSSLSDVLRTLRRDAALAVKKSGPVPPSRMALKKHGRAFTRLVLAAYRNDAITLRDVSSYLEVKLKHLPSIDQHLEAQPADG
jgi:Zn-dependent peptidase ImmA (M78 family)